MCYLSLLSQEKCRDRTRLRKRDRTGSCTSKVNQKEGIGKYESEHSGNMPDVVPKINQRFDADSKSPDDDICVNSDGGCDDLNISPITQASCADSPRAMSNASGSPVTPQNLVKDDEAKFRPFSTPTEGLEDDESPTCTPYGHTAVFNDYLKSKGHNSVKFRQKENVEGSFIEENFKNSQEVKTDGMRRNQRDIKYSNDAEENQLQYLRLSNRDGDNVSHEDNNNTIISQGSVKSTSSWSSSESEAQKRCKYFWLTRHISCDECPMYWSHVVKMVQHVAENGASNLPKVNGESFR